MTRSFIPDLSHVDIPSGSRYRKVEPGFMPYPYKCTGCGSTERACLDLDFQLTDDRIQRGRIGAVLLCTQCFRNCADVMGYIPVELAELNVAAAVNEVMIDDSQRVAHELGSACAAITTELVDRAEHYANLVRNILGASVDRFSIPEVTMDLEYEEIAGQGGEEAGIGRGEDIEPPVGFGATAGFTEGTDPETYAREVLGITPVSYEPERPNVELDSLEGPSRIPANPSRHTKPGSL